MQCNNVKIIIYFISLELFKQKHSLQRCSIKTTIVQKIYTVFSYILFRMDSVHIGMQACSPQFDLTSEKYSSDVDINHFKMCALCGSFPGVWRVDEVLDMYLIFVLVKLNVILIKGALSDVTRFLGQNIFCHILQTFPHYPLAACPLNTL